MRRVAVAGLVALSLSAGAHAEDPRTPRPDAPFDVIESAVRDALREPRGHAIPVDPGRRI